MNKKSKILKVFSFVVVAFVLLLSIFTFIPQKLDNTSYALDESSSYYEFTGNYNFSFVAYTWNGQSLTTFFFDTQFIFNTINDNTFIFGNSRGYKDGDSNTRYQELSLYNQSNNLVTSQNYKDISFVVNGSNNNIFYFTPNNSAKLKFGVYATSLFNSNVFCIELGVRDNFNILPSNVTGSNNSGSFTPKAYYIRYYSIKDGVNDQYIEFEFYTADYYDYNTRLYYLTSNLTDNQIYNEGYNAGLSANQDNIYNQGFNAGKIDGYNQGFDAGVGSANDYTFNGLFSAVIDAPLQAISGLFNFELLGVNLLGFITGLLTLVIIIYIIRICLGG